VPINAHPTVEFPAPIRFADAGDQAGRRLDLTSGRVEAGLGLGRASILFFWPAAGTPPRPLFRGAVHRRGRL